MNFFTIKCCFKDLSECATAITLKALTKITTDTVMGGQHGEIARVQSDTRLRPRALAR